MYPNEEEGKKLNIEEKQRTGWYDEGKGGDSRKREVMKGRKRGARSAAGRKRENEWSYEERDGNSACDGGPFYRRSSLGDCVCVERGGKGGLIFFVVSEEVWIDMWMYR